MKNRPGQAGSKGVAAMAAKPCAGDESSTALRAKSALCDMLYRRRQIFIRARTRQKQPVNVLATVTQTNGPDGRHHIVAVFDHRNLHCRSSRLDHSP